MDKSPRRFHRMKRYILYYALLAFLISGFSCSQNPLAPVKDPTRYTGTWGSKWVIYDDALNTLGGDVLFYPSDPGPAIMSLSNTNENAAYSGSKYFHFKWTGQPIYSDELGTNEHAFAGYSLIITSSPALYKTVQPLDLSKSPYTKITFWIRGSMTAGCHMKFEGPNGAALDYIYPTANWTQYSVTLKDLNWVKDFFKVTIIYPSGGYPTYAAPGQGGWIDVDKVTYEY